MKKKDPLLPPEGGEEGKGHPESNQNEQPTSKQDEQRPPGEDEPPIPNYTWYSQDEMLDKLGMHPNTLKNHRQKGHIGYSKPGAKFFYREDDYQRFLMRFYKGPLVLLWVLSWLGDMVDVTFVM